MQSVQSLQGIFRQPAQNARVESSAYAALQSGWITRLFGCWHREMSRPITREGRTHRVCMECGARRKFDLENWKLVGEYYYEAPFEPVAMPPRSNPQSRPVVLLRSAA